MRPPIYFGIINDSNIHALVKNYYGKKKKNILPEDLRDKPIGEWDVSHVTDMSELFKEMTRFNEPIGDWDVSNVKNMSEMFNEATDFNQPIGKWKTGNVTNMYSMFSYAESFNQPIGDWDVSNVTNMDAMFNSAETFNQPIGDWVVSKVENMSYMFAYAKAFNQPLEKWDVSNVKLMGYMFSTAESFNQPIGEWKNKTHNVVDMKSMFLNAKSFNQPIGEWDVSKVMDMASMFQGAKKFNQPIGDWKVSKVLNMRYMFYNAEEFNQPLNDWDVSKVLNMNSMFSNAKSFNQPLDKWNIYADCQISSIFNGATSMTFPIPPNHKIKKISPKKANYKNIRKTKLLTFDDGIFQETDLYLYDYVMEKDSDGNYANWVFVHRHKDNEKNKWVSRYFYTTNTGVNIFLNLLRRTSSTETNLTGMGLITQNSFNKEYLKEFFSSQNNKKPKLFLIEDNYNLIIPLDPAKFFKDIKRSHKTRKHTASHNFVPYKKQLTNELTRLQQEHITSAKESMENARNIHATRAQLAHVTNLHTQMRTLKHAATKSPRKTMRVRTHSPKLKTRSKSRSKHTKSLG